MKLEIEGFENLHISEKDYEKVLQKAVAKSTTGMTRHIIREVTKQYNVADDTVKNSIKVVKKGIESQIEIKSKVLGLNEFKISNTSKGLKASVRKNKDSTYKGAFLKSVRDFAGKETKKIPKYSNNKSIRMFKKSSSGKLQVLHGASVPGLVSNEKILEELDEIFEIDLQNNIIKELDKIF